VNLDQTLNEFPAILRIAEDILSEVNALPRSRDIYGLIHQDLHESNLIINNDLLTIIDFDDSIYSWYIDDIAIIMFHFAWRFQSAEKSRDQVISEFYPIFMRGYRSIRSLSEEWINLISLFVRLRHIRLFCTLAFELNIREDEWSRTILNTWIPFLQQKLEWIDPNIFENN
jgi:Ser/Thr protein kinase RdoA (MazF antagonist)